MSDPTCSERRDSTGDADCCACVGASRATIQRAFATGVAAVGLVLFVAVLGAVH